MPTPVEMASSLANGTFSEDQAAFIAAEIYQPLLALISALDNKRPEEFYTRRSL
jgi:hypothetical protein